MTQQELEKFSKAELIKLVVELQGQVAELKARLAQKSRPPKTPANSSVPPSAARKPNRQRSPEKEKKRGPKVGHMGKSRRRAKPDVVIECRLEECPDCGADLTEVEQRVVGSSQVVEIPPVQPVVVEAHRYGCTCPKCGKPQAADYPLGMEPERVFGRRIEALVTYLHEVHHLSYARLQIVLQVLFSLLISVGALVNLVQRAAKRLEPAAEAIREEIRGSRVVQSDETGARVAGRNQWQWVFVTETATYHVIAPSRASGVIQEVMGNAVPVVWVRDLWSAQCKAPGQYHQICHAHQLRDLQYVIEAEGSAWAYHMQRLLLRSQRLVKHRERLPTALYQRAVAQLEADCDALLAEVTQGAEAQRLQRRYLKHRNSLFVFLYHPGVPYDNNASERALRNSVIHRKVSGGFRSEAGASAHAIVTSVVDTARKRSQDIMAVLQEHIGPPAPVTQTTAP
jgi:transposase